MEDEASCIIITCQVVSVPYQERAIPFSVNLISFHDVQSFSSSEFVFTCTDWLILTYVAEYFGRILSE